MTDLNGLIPYASHLIIISLYDVSSSQNIVTQINNRGRIAKLIRHARWFVIKQYCSMSGCLTIITLPPSECRWLEATSDWDGRRNHNNLTFDDDTLYFLSLHVYVLCIFLYRSFLFSSKKIALGLNRQSIRLLDGFKPCFRKTRATFSLSAGFISFPIVI
jgi:hypothetical protein